jgi:hypothetical protein
MPAAAEWRGGLMPGELIWIGAVLVAAIGTFVFALLIGDKPASPAPAVLRGKRGR